MTMKPKNDFLDDTQLADLGTRLVALFVDGIILSVITGIIFNTSGDGAWLITFVMTLAYNWFFWTQWQGQTPGKRMVGIRVVKADGSRITGQKVFSFPDSNDQRRATARADNHAWKIRTDYRDAVGPNDFE